MPLTNKDASGSGKGAFHHLWPSRAKDYPAEGEVKALCGQVHVYANDNHLAEVREVSLSDELPKPEEPGASSADTLEEWLQRSNVCSTCADVVREELGLDPRALEDVPGIGHSKADALRRAGFTDVDDLRRASQRDLTEVDAIGNALAARIKADVGTEEDVIRP